MKQTLHQDHDTVDLAAQNPAASPRIPFERPVAVRELQGTREMLLPSLNLGAEGLFLRTDAPLPERSLVEVSFALDGLAPISGQARVVRTVDPNYPGEPAGMALRFEVMEQTPAESLRRFIAASRELARATPTAEALPLFDEGDDPVCTQDFACFCRQPAEE